jgi:hypothetical protein
MAGRNRTRSRRVVSLLVAVSLMTGLMVISAGSVLAGPGGNSANAKLCKDWESLYKEDGSRFVDRGDCTSYGAEGGTILTSPPPPPPDPLPNLVVVDAPSPGAGSYPASGADFGPAPTPLGVSGSLVLVNTGSATPTDGCLPLVGFTAGAIAIIDRGNCTFVDKAVNAQAAGAAAVVIVNNVAGDAITLDGNAPAVTIPAVMVSMVDGAVIKVGLPASGSVKASP